MSATASAVAGRVGANLIVVQMGGFELMLALLA